MFVDRLGESPDKHAPQQSMAGVAAALKLPCVAYLSLLKKAGRPPKLISTYPPSWTADYLRSRYERFDPVVGRAIRHTQTFQWDIGLGPRPQSEDARALSEEAAKFGIRFGCPGEVQGSIPCASTIIPFVSRT